MTRLLLLGILAMVIGCNQSGGNANSNSGSPNMPKDTISHGRVTLLKFETEMGNPDADAVKAGMDAATSTLNDLLADEELKPAAGTFIGRFRLETDGRVRMFLTDKATSISNIVDGKLTDAFVGAAFGGKCSFPELGDIAMVYAEFRIDPPN